MKYFKTKSKTYAIAIQYITGESYYKFDSDESNMKIYSFRINDDKFNNFLTKVKELDKLRFK